MRKRLALLILMILTCLTLVVFGACGGGNEDNSGDIGENPGGEVVDPGPGGSGGSDTPTPGPGGTGGTDTPTPGPGGTDGKDCAALGGHDYVFDATQSKDATCTEEGLIVGVCSRCGDVHKETVSKTAHEYTLKESHEATCLAEGSEVYECKNCHDSYTNHSPKLTHLFELDETKTKAATCTEEGERIMVCSLCGTESKTPIPALGHKLEGAECIDRTCSVCGAITPASKEHDFKFKRSDEEALDDEEALVYCHGDIYDVFACSACGTEKSELSAAAVLHDVKSWEEGELTAGDGPCIYERELVGECALCESMVIRTQTIESHRFISKVLEPATCSNPGTKQTVCSVCGTTNGDPVSYEDPEAHAWRESSTADGVTTFVCTHNGQHKKTSLVSATNDMQVNKGQLQTADAVKLGEAFIEMDAAAKNSLPSDGPLVLGLQTASAGQAGVPSEQLGEKEVYSITLEQQNGELFTKFGEDGKVTVRIPYTLGPDEDPESIDIWYVDEEGKLVSMKATYSGGFAVFTTNHFSYYTVGIMSPEEMCARYGDNFIDRNRPATCTTGGYNTTVCTRCGKIQKNEVLPALGHKMEKDETNSKDPTCTQAGKLVMACSNPNCNKKTETTIPALGHKWEKDATQSTAATCTHAGEDVYTCANSCGNTIRTAIPQTPHNCDEVVKAPTCTEGGYTTFTCRDCHIVYQGAETAPKGHTWNIPEATCTEGQVCTVCNAQGEQARGHVWDIEEPTCTKGQVCTVCGTEGKPKTPHTYVNGVCSVCGDGCEHAWDKVADRCKDATCTEAGYTVSVCSKCHTEKTETIDPIPHTFDEYSGRCTVCGTVDPARASAYLDLLKTLYADSYTIDISGVHFSVNTGYTTQSFVMEKGAGAVAFKDGKLLYHIVAEKIRESEVYGSGSGHVADIQSYEAYSDGDVICVSFTMNGEKMFQRVPANLAYGQDGPSYAVVVKILQDETLRGYLKDLFDKNYMTLSVILEHIVDGIFTRTGTGDTYTLTLNREAILDFNTSLKDKTVADLFDEIFGEGTFTSVVDYLKQLAAMTAREGIDDLLEKAKEYHIEKDKLIEIINHVGAIVQEEIERYKVTLQGSNGSGADSGNDAAEPSSEEEKEPFDINKFYDDPVMTQHSFSELCFGMMADEFIRTVDGITVILGENSLYGYLSETSDGYVSEEMIFDIVNEIFSDDTVTLSVNVVSGSFKSVRLKIDDFELDLEHVGESGSLEVGGTIDFSVGGKVEVPDTAPDAALMAAIERRIASGNGSYSYRLSDTTDTNGTRTVSDLVFTMENGKINAVRTDSVYNNYTLVSADSTGESASLGYRYVAVFTDLGNTMMQYTEGCGDGIGMFYFSFLSGSYTFTKQAFKYSVKNGAITETDLGESSRFYGSSSLTLIFDESTNSFTEDYAHTYVTDTSKSETADDVDCGEFYTVVEKCTVCGATRETVHYKAHRREDRYTLVEGAHSCLEGVICTEVCTVCGEELRSYEMAYGYHYFNTVKYEIKTNYGVVVLETAECACKQEGARQSDSYEIERYGIAAYLIKDGSERSFDNLSYYCSDTLYSVQFRLSENGNAWRISIEGTVTHEGCYLSTSATAKVYLGQRLLGSKQFSLLVSAEHTCDEKTTITYTENDGVVTTQKTETTYSCGHGVNLIEESERRFDKDGRLIYNRTEMRRADGSIIRYERVEYKRNGCSCDVYTYDSPDDAEPEVETSTEHEYVTKTELLGTGCYDGVKISTACKYCGKVISAPQVTHEHVIVARPITVPVGAGDLTIGLYACACGAQMQNINVTYNVGYNHYYLNGGILPGYDVRAFISSQFPDLIVFMQQGETGEFEGCYAHRKLTFTVVYGETLIKTIELDTVVENHKVTETELEKAEGGEYGENGYRRVTKTECSCGHISGYTETVEVRYDEAGRKLSELRQTVDNADGSYLYYSRMEREYDGCDYIENRYDVNGKTNYVGVGSMHDYEWMYVLVDGATSCEQGWREVYRCKYCGESDGNMGGWIGYDHSTFNFEKTITTKDGEFMYTYETCACGKKSSFDSLFHIHNGQPFICGYGEDGNLVCSYVGCEVTATVTQVVDDSDPCYKGMKTVLTVSDKTLEFFYFDVADHAMTAKRVEYTTYTLEKDHFTGSRERYEFTYECQHMRSYSETNETRKDEFGRTIYEFHEMYELETGVQISYEETKTEYFKGTCNYVVYYRDDPNGEFIIQGIGTRHGSTEYTYTLLRGEGSSCEYGVEIIGTCSCCKTVVSNRVSYSHETHGTTEIIRKANGDIVTEVTTYVCTCGKVAGRFEHTDRDCYFYTNVYDGEYYIYRCGGTDCNVVMKEKQWTVKSGCDTQTHSIYTFYEGDQVIGNPDGYYGMQTSTYHRYTDRTLESITYTMEENGFTGYREVVRRDYYCTHEYGYTRVEEHRYDKYGREIYYLYSQIRDGNNDYDSYYTEIKREYPTEGSCICNVSERRSPTGTWYTSTETHHGDGETKWAEPTCTQCGYNRRYCEACGELLYETITDPFGHNYSYDGTCWRCGLSNEKTSDGILLLEDMTHGDSETYKVGVWARDVEDVDDMMYIVALVYVDGSGIEHEIEVELDWTKTVPNPRYPESFVVTLEKSLVEEAIRAAQGKVEAGWVYRGLGLTYLPKFDNENQAIRIVLTDDLTDD